uniref:UDP binding domain-containing protein n=1 Tax=Liquorilactobacillus sicerae TaxID=1416943 RepID=UPI0024818492
GYCLPKDSKQLLASYEGVPQELMTAIVKSNDTRKRFIVEQVLAKKPKTVGIYKLAMKSGSDNFRQSSIIDVMNYLAENHVEIIIYEPTLKAALFQGKEVDNNLADFKKKADLIIANRVTEEIKDSAEKLYTRDQWKRD